MTLLLLSTAVVVLVQDPFEVGWTAASVGLKEPQRVTGICPSGLQAPMAMRGFHLHEETQQVL